MTEGRAPGADGRDPAKEGAEVTEASEAALRRPDEGWKRRGGADDSRRKTRARAAAVTMRGRDVMAAEISAQLVRELREQHGQRG